MLHIFVFLQESQERWGLQTKARVLSRKVWELLMLLPTNPAMLQGFKSITNDQVIFLYQLCQGIGSAKETCIESKDPDQHLYFCPLTGQSLCCSCIMRLKNRCRCFTASIEDYSVPGSNFTRVEVQLLSV